MCHNHVCVRNSSLEFQFGQTLQSHIFRRCPFQCGWQDHPAGWARIELQRLMLPLATRAGHFPSSNNRDRRAAAADLTNVHARHRLGAPRLRVRSVATIISCELLILRTACNQAFLLPASAFYVSFAFQQTKLSGSYYDCWLIYSWNIEMHMQKRHSDNNNSAYSRRNNSQQVTGTANITGHANVFSNVK